MNEIRDDIKELKARMAEFEKKIKKEAAKKSLPPTKKQDKATTKSSS